MDAETPEPDSTHSLIGRHLYPLPTPRDRHLRDQSDHPADLDAAPRFTLVERSHWPHTLTAIIAGAFSVTIITAVCAVAFDATTRVAIVSSLTATLSPALLYLVNAWRRLPHSRAARRSARRSRRNPS